MCYIHDLLPTTVKEYQGRWSLFHCCGSTLGEPSIGCHGRGTSGLWCYSGSLSDTVSYGILFDTKISGRPIWRRLQYDGIRRSSRDNHGRHASIYERVDWRWLQRSYQHAEWTHCVDQEYWRTHVRQQSCWSYNIHVPTSLSLCQRDLWPTICLGWAEEFSRQARCTNFSTFQLACHINISTWLILRCGRKGCSHWDRQSYRDIRSSSSPGASGTASVFHHRNIT